MKFLTSRHRIIKRADLICAYAKALHDKDLSSQLHSLLTAIAIAQASTEGRADIPYLTQTLGISPAAAARHCRLSPHLIKSAGHAASETTVTITQEAVSLLIDVEAATNRILRSLEQ